MRAIDADRLVEIFDTIPDKESTAIFIPNIVETIKEQPSVQPIVEPCEDYVSREDVKKFIKNLTRWVVRKDSFVNEGLLYDDVMFGLDELTSVQPARIKAKWLKHIRRKYDEYIEKMWECSICGQQEYTSEYKYCPNCGAKMD